MAHTLKSIKEGKIQELSDGDVGTFLHLFAQNGSVDMVKRNIHRTSDKFYKIESETVKNQRTALHLACAADDAEKLPRYVKAQ